MGIQSNGEWLFDWPVDGKATLTRGFINDGNGIDIVTNAVQTSGLKPIYASEAGTVDQLQYWDGKTKTGMQSYGNMVRIRHNNYNGSKLETRYAHLKEYLVKNGQHVYEGQLIGYSGATGNCSGPHLHFEVIYHDCRVNPLNWLDDNFICSTQTVMRHLGSYHSVPRESSKGDYIKIHATGVDMQAIIALCENLKLTYERSDK